MSVCVCSGMGGHYELDASGDRDINLSVVYTTGSYEVSPFIKPKLHFDKNQFNDSLIYWRQYEICRALNLFD